MTLASDDVADDPHTSETFKPLLKKLFKSPSEFTADDTTLAFRHLLSLSKPSSSSVTPAQIGAFLTALSIHGLERRPEILSAAAQVLREHCIKPTVEGYAEETTCVVDIVGTGGDGHDTFNVSTSAAIIAAGAGARVCKHGNRAATSSSGSADLLLSLGCSLSPLQSLTSSTPFVFLLAPHYHPALAPLSPIRKTLPFRTILNLLGPLVNPAFPHAMILGVPQRELGIVFASALREGGVRGWVVCGHEGLDEVSCAGGTWIWKIPEDLNEEIVEESIHPSDFDLPTHPLSIVKGGSPSDNAKILKELLTTQSEDVDPSLLPILDFVLMNTSALLTAAGIAKDLKHGVQLAKESVSSGRAWDAIVKYQEATQTA